jgi:WD40 repeat protein
MSLVQVQKLHTITGHNDCVYTLERGPLPELFFSGAGDGMIVQWSLRDPDTGHLIAKLPNSVYALHYLRQQNVLIAGHNYDGIHLIDPENKKEVGSLQLTKAAIFDLKSLGKSILVASGDGSVQKVDSDTLTVKGRNVSSEKSARTIAIHPEGSEIAVGYSDHMIRVFDFDLRLKREWKAHENSIFTLLYSSDGRTLFSGSRDARLKTWDVTNDYQKAAEVVAHLFAINHIDFSPDNKHFVTCSLDKSIKVWDLEEMKLLKVIDRARHGGHRTSVNKLLWTSHEEQLLSASDDRTISVWHIIF